MRVNALLLFSVLSLTLAETAMSQSGPWELYFVNGIQVSKAKAEVAARRVDEILKNSTTRQGANKRDFQVDLVYNPIGFYESTDNEPDLRQDVMELFVEKTAEEHFSDDFRRILAPHNASTVLDQTAAARVKAYFDDMTPGGNFLELSGTITDENLAASRQVINSILERLRTPAQEIFVAHSQGSLLVNLAWASYVAEVGQEARRYSRFVNVANTSLFAISGLNLTHDGDEALFAAANIVGNVSLQSLPSTGRNWTRTTPRCSNAACDFEVAPGTFGGASDTSGRFEHAFLETYLSTAQLRDVFNSQGVNFTPGATRFVDRFEDLVYAAAESLDDADGDGVPDSLDACRSAPANTPNGCPENSAPPTQQVVRQPSESKDIWTTSVYSYEAGVSRGPGGGLNDDSLRVGGWGDEYRSLLSFDLTGLPAQASSAKIELFSQSLPNVTPTAINVDYITTPWNWRTQGTGTDHLRLWWADQPTSTPLFAAPLPAPQQGQWFSVDVTTLYNQWQSGAVPNYGIKLRPVSTNNNWAYFYSSDFTGDPSLRPRLVVMPSPPNGLITIELHGTVTQIPNPGALATAAATYGYPLLNIAVGDPYTFRYTFDPSVPDSAPNLAILGEYPAITTATLTTPQGTFTFAGPTLYRPGPISALDGTRCLGGPGDQFFCDQYYATIQAPFSPPNSAEGSLYAQAFLQDFDASVFASDALPIAPPALSQLEQATFRAGVVNSGAFSGSVTSVSVVR